MPAVLSGQENAQERALAFYATKAILDTECCGIPFDVRLWAFGTIMGQDFVAGRPITDFNQSYEQQLEDPDRFTILSYHDRVGDVINGTCATDTMVLKPTGDPLVASAPGNCRSSHVKFVTIQDAFDFSYLFLPKAGDCPKSMYITTTAEIPQTIGYVLCTSSGTASLVSVSTYDGPDDICAMNPEEFRDSILKPCYQSRAATLVAPMFGRAVAILDTSDDESNCDLRLKLAFPTACEDIKVTSCPGWNHRPAQIFDNIKQVITDEHGNVYFSLRSVNRKPKTTT